MLNSDQNAMLQQIGAALQSAFGANFISLYLVGSFGTERQMRNSDVDLVLVTEVALDPADLQRLAEITTELRSRYGELIGFVPRTQRDLIEKGVGVKYDGRLIAGRELRDQIREPEARDRALQLRNAAVMFLKRIHRVPEVSSAALRYPDEQDPYCGYVDGGSNLPLHRLMSLTFLAHARLGTEHSVFANIKHEIPALYARHFHDGTERFVSALFEDVRGRWQYEIPTDVAEQARLRELCRSALNFERTCLAAIGV